MDKELRNLLVEVARGVLRALAPDEAPKPVAQPAPKRESVQATQAPAASTEGKASSREIGRAHV